MKRKLVVIGGDAAGMTAAAKVRRIQEDWDIIVFERSPHTSYSACGIPYFIGGQVESEVDLIVRSPEKFKEEYNIQAYVKHEVVRIHRDKSAVLVKDLTSEKIFWESYDYLLIATGASPIKPAIPGVASKGVFSMSTLQSGMDLWRYIQKESPKSATVIGGGYIGVEMAEAFLERGMEVRLIDLADQIMATLDKEMAMLVTDYMNDKGIKTYLGESVTDIVADKAGKIKEVVTDKQSFETDLLLFGIGVRPNTQLAEEAGIKRCDTGAILTDVRLQTSAPDIWAAGDCASSYHLLKETEIFVSLGTVANKHGLVAGSNIAGEKAVFPGVLGTAITRFMDMEIARTGLSEAEAIAMGIEYVTASISSSTKASYYPGSEKITVKLLARKDSGLLLGAQIVGMAGAAKRIDTIAAALTGKLTATDLVFSDLSYAPPFSSVWDPVQIAARKLI